MSFDIRIFLFYTFIVSLPFWLFLVRKKINDWTRELAGYITLFSGIFSLVTLFVISPIRIPSQSMEPSLNTNSLHFIQPTAYSLSLPGFVSVGVPTGEPKRGDIIGFYSPVNASKLFAKRVIGLPGESLSIFPDRIVLEDGSVIHAKQIGTKEGKEYYQMDFNNGNSATYQFIQGLSSSSRQYVEIEVPKNHYFVLGDNRDHSYDSRSFGFVKRNRLAGRVIN